MLTESELEAIEKRLEAAEQRPLKAMVETLAAKVPEWGDAWSVLAEEVLETGAMSYQHIASHNYENAGGRANAELHANAPADIAALLADLKLYKKAVEEIVESEVVWYWSDDEVSHYCSWDDGTNTDSFVAPALATVLKEKDAND